MGVGIGIKPELINKYLNDFSMHDLHHPDSNGLSLALTRQTLKRLGGQLEIESTAGIGSTFSLMIPSKSQDEDDKEWMY